jgi:rRNA maturation endonuclease Nob1
MESFGIMEIFAGIISMLCLVVFFVMSFNLGNIRKNLQSIQRILKAWQEETGYGLVYDCKKCNKKYEGKKAVCPHCGDPKQYD